MAQDGRLLAGDVGGTNARLALFEPDGRTEVARATYPSREHTGLDEIIRAFLGEHPAQVTGACVGVAGPVRDGRTQEVNLAWPVDAASLAATLGLDGVVLLNDLEANAWGIDALGRDDVVSLQAGATGASGNAAVISAGTGLGEALIVRETDGATIVVATEGGHVDFAPRNEDQVELWRSVMAEFGHVSVERVCSGMGLVAIDRFLRARAGAPDPAWLVKARDGGDAAAAISAAGLTRSDAVSSDALDMMIEIYAAQAANLALTCLAVGGVYLGGGISPKILPRLKEGGFLRAFTDKGRFTQLMKTIPVRVIVNQDTALMGAALRAARV